MRTAVELCAQRSSYVHSGRSMRTAGLLTEGEERSPFGSQPAARLCFPQVSADGRLLRTLHDPTGKACHTISSAVQVRARVEGRNQLLGC